MIAQAGGLVAAAVFSWLCLSHPNTATAATNIVEYPLNPYQNYVMERIINGPDQAYWFAEFFYGIGRVTVTNNVPYFYHYTDNPYPYCRPESIVTGPDNNMWFTEYNSNRVCRITTNGTIIGWQLAPNAHPTGITVGPDGNLWFLEYGTSKIGTITTNGITTNSPLKEYGPVTTNSLLYNIITGSDGNLWFTESYAGKIGKITTAGVISEYPLPTTNCGPYDIVSGPDGALWFTEFYSNKLGRITVNAVSNDFSFITEFPMPLTTNQFTFYTNNPNGILVGPDSNIWYADKGANLIGRFNPTNHILTYLFTPTTNSQPTFLATGPDKNIWVCEGFVNYIAVIYQTNLLTLNAANIASSSANFPTMATYQNSNPTNTIIVNWGDGATNTITTTNFSGSTNGLTVVTNIAGGGIINGSHAFASTNIHPVTITVVDSTSVTAIANITISAPASPPPALNIISGGGGVITVTWPTAPPGFVLQLNTNLTNTNWITLPNTTSGSTNIYSLTNPPGDAFFRLINTNQ